MLSHYAAYQESVPDANGHPSSPSENHAEDADVSLEHGENENGSLENDGADANRMEE